MTMTKTPFSDIELQFKAGYFCGSEQYTDEVLAFFKSKWEERDEELQEAIESRMKLLNQSNEISKCFIPFGREVAQAKFDTLKEVLSLLDYSQKTTENQILDNLEIEETDVPGGKMARFISKGKSDPTIKLTTTQEALLDSNQE